uniref:Uncharacterized protein n=1 Tax=Cacopsylla melanoneura TaxID=428564 RepID=A0A8D9EYS9_9HEMI
MENAADTPVDIPPKKKSVTKTESDGSNDESFLTPVDSGDAPLPKKKSKTTTPDPFVMENTADTPVNIPPKKTKNTSSDDSELANYLNELKKPKPAQKGYSSSNGQLDVQYRSLGGDTFAPNDTYLKTDKENIVNAPKNGEPNETLNPVLGLKNKTQTSFTNDLLNNVGNYPKGKLTSQDTSNYKESNPLAEHENIRNEIVLTPKNQLSGSPNNGVNKNDINGSPYGPPKMPTDPSGVSSSGISHQQIPPNGPLAFENNRVNSSGSNVPKSPQVGSPADGH